MASRPIDEKIVAMKMDNSDFKRKAVETTGLFGKLRDSLNKIPGVNLGGITNDLNGIKRAANGTNLDGLASSVEGVSSRFSTMGVIATTALATITNKAVNAGMALTKSFGMDQLTSGFREYELKMGSIQTILANTARHGTTLDDVSRNFEELNAYADKTIYSFADMTKNIGLFTNAGLKLDESTSMIKGFSNAAAASGTNAEGAARAAYQLSQGLSSGYLMQMDWMSLTNAGMGNDNMKRDLIALGQAFGTLDVSTETAVRDWKSLLSDEKWLTSEVMSTYLQTMAGDIDKATLMTMGLTEAQADLLVQNAKTGEESATMVRTFTQLMDTLKEGVGSGWATTWELIFGDFEEATRLWTAISNLIGPILEKQGAARNNMLRSVIAGDAITNVLGGIKNIATPIIQVFKAIGAGFKVAFPPMGLSGVESLLAGFKNLTSGMTLSAKSVENIKTIFAGFFSIFAIGWDVIKGAASIILALIPSFSGLGSKVLELIAKVAQIPIAFNGANESGKAFGSAMDGLKTIASGVSTALEFIVGGLISLADTVGMAFGVLSKGDVADGPWKDRKIVDWLLAVREGFSSFGDTISSINWTAIGAGFVAFFSDIKSGFEWIVDKAAAVGTAIKNAIPDGNQLVAGGFIAALIAMVGMAVKMAWDLYEVFTGWGKIGAGVAETFEGLGGALESFGMQVKAQALLLIAVAVGILAASFWAISRLKFEDIAKGLYAIIGSLSAIVIAMQIMTKYNITGTGMGAAVQIIALSVAVSIMASALNKMKGMDWNELGKGVVGLAGTMGVLAVAMIAMSAFGGPALAASALQFVGIAVAVHILVSAIKRIEDIEPETLKKGLLTLAAILVSLGTFLAIAGKSKFGAASAVGIIGIAAAVMLISKSVKSLGEMDVGVLKQGLLTIGAILLAVGAFSLLSANLLGAGAGILLLAVAMNLLMVPILALGNMSLETLATGIGAMAIALVAIGAASLLMTGMIASGAGLILVAVAMNMLMVPIAALSAIPLKALAVGIGALAIGILAIGGAAALLGLAAVPMLLGAAGILALGVAMLAAGAGISLFGAGLVTLAGMTGTAVTTIVAMMGTLILGMVSLIPAFTDFIGKLGMRILETIEKYAPIVINKVYDIMIKILVVLTERVPEFAEAATNLITAFLDSMAEQLPKIVESASNLMIATVEALALAVKTNGPRFTEAFRTLMNEISILIIQSGVTMITSLFGWIPGVTDAATKIGQAAEENIRGSLDAEGLGASKGDAFNTSLSSKAGNARVAGVSLAKNASTGAGTAGLETIGIKQGTDFTSGLGSKATAANTAGTALATSGKTGAGSVNLTSTGTNFSLGFVNGMGSQSVLSKIGSTAKSLASKALTTMEKWLGVASPAKETIAIGEHTGQGLANGVKSKTKEVTKSSKSLSGVLLDFLGVKGVPAKEASKGGAVAGENYSKGVESTKKKASKAGNSVGKSAGKGLAKGIKDTKKDSEKAAKEAADKIKEAFKDAMDTADYKYEMEEIDTAKYIKELEKIQKAYSKHPDLAREINRKLKTEREKQTKEIEDAFKKRMDAEKKAISDRKYHNNLSLTQELDAWQKIVNKYKKGTEERSEADKEVFRIKNEINTKLLDLNKEYVSKVEEANKKLIDGERELRQEYEDSVKSKADSLAGFTGLFDKVDEMVTASGQELIDNLIGQNRLFDEWSTNIFALGNKGIDNGMLTELREMGPKSAAEIKAINSMTAEQLTIYVNEWKKKQNMARVEAVRELDTLKKETETKIKELHAQTAKQLAEYKNEWVKSVNDITKWTKEGFVGLNTSMQTIGGDAVKGLMKGLANMEGPLKTQAKAIADSVALTIRKALQVKSPSRVLMAIGEFAGEGLAIGLGNKVSDVAASSKSLAMTAKDSINDFISGFELDNGDDELHFKAIIDYDTIDPNRLGSLRAMNIQPDMSFANNMIAATKASFRQNDNNFPKDTSNNDSSNGQVKDNGHKQPIVIQIPLDGRVIAEQTYEDVSELMGSRSNLDYSMIGG